MKENTWKHTINSAKAAPQSPARHFQFKSLAAVLGNKDEKLDNDPGNIFAISTATNVQVALHFFFFFPGWRKTGWTVPKKKEHLPSCYKQTLLKIGALGRCVPDTYTEPSAPARPLSQGSASCTPQALPRPDRKYLNEWLSCKQTLRKASKSMF